MSEIYHFEMSDEGPTAKPLRKSPLQNCMTCLYGEFRPLGLEESLFDPKAENGYRCASQLCTTILTPIAVIDQMKPGDCKFWHTKVPAFIEAEIYWLKQAIEELRK